MMDSKLEQEIDRAEFIREERKYDAMMDEMYQSMEEHEESICLSCNGSGEGYTDGSKCQTCNGKGEV
jgi:DnaJ-class molecular chaperone